MSPQNKPNVSDELRLQLKNILDLAHGKSAPSKPVPEKEQLEPFAEGYVLIFYFGDTKVFAVNREVTRFSLDINKERVTDRSGINTMYDHVQFRQRYAKVPSSFSVEGEDGVVTRHPVGKDFHNMDFYASRYICMNEAGERFENQSSYRSVS